MSKVTIQGYLLPQELLDLVVSWCERYDLHAVPMQFFPEFAADYLPDGEVLADHVARAGLPRRVCLGLDKPQMETRSPYEFMIKNPDWLVVDIGVETEHGLKESVIGANTQSPDPLRAWKGIAADIRKHTLAGLWCFNAATGEKNFYRSFRYSPAVAARARTGTRLLATGTGIFCQIEEPA
jgi:hypothetical protein